MRILTGDRPTGLLHLGHYVGSLRNRVVLQDQYDQYILIANLQALTDNYDKGDFLRDNIYKVVACYLATGIDPTKSVIFLQSELPQLSELTMYFMNLVTLSRASRNPTVKEEIRQKGFQDSVSMGFLNYPISQAADILLFHGELVPVGNDQLPMIEQTNEIVRTFNYVYNVSYFKECQPLLSNCERLIGLDGQAKMSKSLHNAIYLGDNEKALYSAVMKMYTDPHHIKVSDPGRIEGNVVFSYLDIFDKNREEVEALKMQYQQGGLGDMVLKKRLFIILNELLAPIRERYHFYYNDKNYLKKIVLDGTAKAYDIAQKNIKEIKQIMKIDF